MKDTPFFDGEQMNQPLNLKTTIEFWKEGEMCIAYSPELDMVSQGHTIEEARQNLLEVVSIQFEEMQNMGTLNQFLNDIGVQFDNGIGISQNDRIGFDKVFLPLPASFQ